MKNLIIIAVLLLTLSLVSFAQVPNKISYQGLLTNSSGTPVQDGSYDLKFEIYNVPVGGTFLYKYTYSGVSVRRGTFSVILEPSASIFKELLYVDVTAVAGPGITSPIIFSPRSELTSTPYSLNSLSLSVPCTLTASVAGGEIFKVINNNGGSALTGEISSTGASASFGVRGLASATSTGTATGGLFSASGSGESQKVGISTSGNGNTYWDVYGIWSSGGNHGSGPAFGGNFRAFSPGTGTHYGVYSDAYGESNAETYGVYGYGRNTSTGAVYGIYSKAENTSSGDARGGYFLTDPSNRGTGTRFGIDAVACGGGAYPAGTFAVKGWSSNNSSGDSYGGYFTSYAEPGNTGRNYGSYSEGYSIGGANVFGVVGSAENPSTGEAYGGSFSTSYFNRGGNKRYGVSASAYSGSSSSAYGVKGYAENFSFGNTYGGYFTTDSNGTGTHYGIYASSEGNSSTITYGSKIDVTNSSTGSAFAGYFSTSSSSRGTGGSRVGIYGSGYGASSGGTYGVSGYATGNGSGAVYGGQFYAETGGPGTKYGIHAYAPSGGSNRAGYFAGDVTVTGTLSKGGGTFKIDHPLDPENKYLYHSFVESPDMMNVYNGNVILNSSGEAVVELPKYFNALNKDFRYQLTCIGGYANVYIAEEVIGNKFKIAGGTPGLKVSWQVTGVRKDKFAEANRIHVEVDKTQNERGKYLHPEAFGLNEDRGIHYELHQEWRAERKKMEEEEIKQKNERQTVNVEQQEFIKRQSEQRMVR